MQQEGARGQGAVVRFRQAAVKSWPIDCRGNKTKDAGGDQRARRDASAQDLGLRGWALVQGAVHSCTFLEEELLPCMGLSSAQPPAVDPNHWLFSSTTTVHQKILQPTFEKETKMVLCYFYLFWFCLGNLQIECGVRISSINFRSCTWAARGEESLLRHVEVLQHTCSGAL